MISQVGAHANGGGIASSYGPVRNVHLTTRDCARTRGLVGTSHRGHHLDIVTWTRTVTCTTTGHGCVFSDSTSFAASCVVICVGPRGVIERTLLGVLYDLHVLAESDSHDKGSLSGLFDVKEAYGCGGLIVKGRFNCSLTRSFGTLVLGTFEYTSGSDVLVGVLLTKLTR